MHALAAFPAVLPLAMSWSTVIWSMAAAAAFTMALPHFIIGLRQRGARVNLVFALTSFAVVWLAAAEFRIIHAQTAAESGRAIQLAHVPLVLVVTGIVGFVYLSFGTARLWLGLLAVGLRAVCLLPNFLQPPNQTFSEMTGVKPYLFFGETLTVPVGTPSSWLLLAYLSSILFLIYVIEASVKLWRQGHADARRRAGSIGGGIVFFIVVAQSASVLINAGLMTLPFLISLPFLAIVAAMGIELTAGVIRAAQLTHALQASEERVSLAAESARLALWEWEAARDEILMASESRRLFGFEPGERINFARLNERVHPDDRSMRQAAVDRARQTGGAYEIEYRLLLPDGTIRWMAARGRTRLVGNDPVPRIVGVSIDITREKLASAEVESQRTELGRLSRVVLLGEMATSLAHELNQPLTAILANAGAAQRSLMRDQPDLAELREVLADIAADGRRAGEVIRGIKGMVRKVEGRRTAVDLNEVTASVLRLVRADALAQDCALRTALAPELPAVNGDAVQLQQVLLNLVINAFDAMRSSPGEVRAVELTTRVVDSMVEVAVRDHGPGLPPGASAKVFERFFSTKAEGMGMGLAIARSIIEAHQGTIEAANADASGDPAARGARFWFRLPVRVEPAGEPKA